MKTFLKSAICVMAVATMVAVVSCKKDDQNAKFNNSNSGQTVSHFDPSHITDMNAYLKEFKQQMRQSQYAKDAEMLSLEEAAWHLSSVANYDFANANVEFTDLRHDTLHYQVSVTDGQVSMADLNAVYADMARDIDAFYQSLDLQDKHFRFIGAEISEEGNVTASMSISYIIPKRNLGDNLWYFENEDEAWLFCVEFFDGGPYPLNGLGMTEIERALNLIESHTINHSDPNRVYYTYTRQVDFYFEDHIDPYGSPFYHNSRLLATTGYFYVDIPLENLCYCVDSYTGLGYGQAQTNESPVHWHLRFIQGVIREQQVGHHFLTVKYGRRNVIPDHNEY